MDKEELKVNELTEEKMEKVSGGGISIHYGDYCHFTPSKWSHNPNFGVIYGLNRCETCIHNPHPSWKDSNCEFDK